VSPHCTREALKSTSTPPTDPVNEITVAYHQLIDEMGPDEAEELLERLEFHPVFTAHPTEARRKAVEGKIRRIAELLGGTPQLGGSDLEENERASPTRSTPCSAPRPSRLKKPTPVEESDTIIDIFDNTLFDTIPKVYRRFDDWILGAEAGRVAPVCPAFFHPGSWIGSDRDGNPNVTAKVSRMVARKFTDHVRLSQVRAGHQNIGRNLTVESETTPRAPSSPTSGATRRR
jgi:phosphoenolpyruvate carboxylase